MVSWQDTGVYLRQIHSIGSGKSGHERGSGFPLKVISGILRRFEAVSNDYKGYSCHVPKTLGEQGVPLLNDPLSRRVGLESSGKTAKMVNIFGIIEPQPARSGGECAPHGRTDELPQSFQLLDHDLFHRPLSRPGQSYRPRRRRPVGHRTRPRVSFRRDAFGCMEGERVRFGSVFLYDEDGGEG